MVSRWNVANKVLVKLLAIVWIQNEEGRLIGW